MRRFLVIASSLWLAGFTPESEDATGWTFTVSKGAEQGVTTVSSPVRDGKTAISFMLAPGQCTENDCSNDRERLELKQVEYQHEGESWWYAWSVYVPEDFAPVWPVRVFLGQFHQEGGPPAMLFSLEPEGLMFETRFHKGEEPLLIPAADLKGRWHDIAMQVDWSKSHGRVRISVNGEQIVDRLQQTMSRNDVYFKFGIYRAHLTRADANALPTHTVIYDRLRRGRSKADVMP
jgi:hypothetical protein